jgi:mRNA interferase MazF
MAITFHPTPGAVLVCNYQTGFIEPEMVKTRLCVVITPRLRRRDGLCTVVPLSTTAPDPVEDYHFEVEFARELPRPWEGDRKWAKCDMLSTVGYGRLSPIGIGRGPDGKRRYIYPHVLPGQLKAIRAGVLCALTLRELTQHL